MFCPNCGTQNPETAPTCSKCNFNLKGAAAPKFKGTMLMMNNTVPRPPTPAFGAPPPAAGNPPPAAGSPPPGAKEPADAAPAAPMPMPSKLKGTMVGVAPPMGAPVPAAAPVAPRPPSVPPVDVPPPPPFIAQAPQPNFGATMPADPGLGRAANMSPVNPLGGTIAADTPNPYPQIAQAAAQARAGAGGYGGDAFGAPPPPQNYGAPPPQEWGQPGGAPGFGRPGSGDFQPQPQPQAQQEWGAPPGGMPQQGFGGQPYGMGPGPQQMQQPPGAMMPYGQPGQMMQPQGAPIQPGAHGPKGVARDATMALVWSLLSCGFYQLWWFIVTCGEMSAYLQRDEPSWWKVILLSSVTCGIYGLYWQIARCGALVQEMQQRAGLPNPENHGFLYIVPYYNVILLQNELNKVWQSPQ